jgi:hypothetical protein
MKKLIPYKFLVITILFLQNVLHCQTTILGSAVNFVVFTGDGDIANTGSSLIAGDIGTNLGGVSGLAPATSTVTGNTHIANSTTNQAKIDLIAGFTLLISVHATNSIHPPAFGIGETVLPGIYAISGAGSVGGNLTLDAQNDTNAVFVFRFTGAFNIGAAANIILANKAKICNVYWVSYGAIGIGAAAFVKGNFISNSAAVFVGATTLVEGRLFSISGAITFGPSQLKIPQLCVPSYFSNFNATYNCLVSAKPKFMLFTSSGAVTFLGSSNLTGDIGTNAGGITGYGTSTVVGTYHASDSVTNQAKSDLQTTYGYLTALPVTNAFHTPALVVLKFLTLEYIPLLALALLMVPLP